MKKLRIEPDQLQVESFATEEAPAERGTVGGRGLETGPGDCPPTADFYCTVGAGCTEAYYTCGGWNCETWEAAHCQHQSGAGQQTCSICDP